MVSQFYVPLDGDVVLGAKPSFLQGLGEGVGDAFRHAGMVAMIRGRTQCVQVKDHVIGMEPIESFIDRYTEVVVLRHPAAGVARTAADWSVSRLGVLRRYPLDDCFLAGLVGCARAAQLPSKRLKAVVAAAVERARSRPRDTGLSCSALIAEGFARGGVELVRSLVTPLSPVVPIVGPSAVEGPQLDSLRPSMAQLRRIAVDARAVDRALRLPVHEFGVSASHNRLVTPGDLARSDQFEAVARFVAGRPIGCLA